MVINQNTDIDRCIKIALSQSLEGLELEEIYKKFSIRRYNIDLTEQPIHNIY